MARVLYGVAGDTNGHASRALAIASRLPEHEFHFVGGDRVCDMVGDRYPVLTIPVLATVNKDNRTHVLATCAQGLGCMAGTWNTRRRILDLIDRWRPDLAISDFEFFLPVAARAAGLRCISIDHQHVLSACRYPVPASQRLHWALSCASLRLFFGLAARNLVVSFFHPELRPGGSSELMPPVLRPEVATVSAKAGDHVFIYQTTSTFAPLIAAARQMSRPVVVYGWRDEKATEGNITFKPFDRRTILEDLAGSAYAVVNGGHNVICEALYYHKPVLCFPLEGGFEQFLNAWYVREMGYGEFSTSRQPTPALLRDFEANLNKYQSNIEKKFVDGTEAVIQRVRELIGGGSAARPS